MRRIFQLSILSMPLLANAIGQDVKWDMWIYLVLVIAVIELFEINVKRKDK